MWSGGTSSNESVHAVAVSVAVGGVPVTVSVGVLVGPPGVSVATGVSVLTAVLVAAAVFVATAVFVAVLVVTAVLEGTDVLVGIVVLVALGPGVGVVKGTEFTAASASTRP